MLETSARLLDLLSLLQRRPYWTGPELAERLEITVRSVRRDVDRLRQLGYPVESAPGPTGGYRLASGADLPPLQLDDDEATAVWAALATTSAAVTGFGEAAVSALGKLDRVLPVRLRPQVQALLAATETMDGPAVDAVDAELLLCVARACAERERLRLTYVDRDGARTERRLDPHRLVATGRRWYLVAFDVDRDDWRTLRADRIEAAQATGHRFEHPDPPDATDLVSRSTTVAPYRWTATAVIDAPIADVRRRVPATVAVLRDLDGERTQLVTGSDSLAAVAGHLVALDLPFEVFDPPELRAHLAAVGRRVAAAHRSAPRRGRTSDRPG